MLLATAALGVLFVVPQSWWHNSTSTQPSASLTPAADATTLSTQGDATTLSTQGDASALSTHEARTDQWCPGRCPVQTSKLLARGGLHWGRSAANHSKAPTCDLCAHRWLFVVSVGGRTGSTTLLEMLLAHPAFDIAGENNGLLGRARAMWDTAALVEQNNAGTDPSKMHIAYKRPAVQPLDLLCSLQSFFGAVTETDAGPGAGAGAGDHRVRGFKEIRWSPHQLGLDAQAGLNETAMVEFLDALFPCSRVIFNSRTAASSTFPWGGGGRRGGSDSDAAAMTRSLLDLHHRWRATPRQRWKSFWLNLGDDAHPDDFTPAKFNELLDWAGERRCRYTDVGHANQGAHFSKMRQLQTSSLLRGEDCTFA